MGLKAIRESKVENMVDALDNLEKIRAQLGCDHSATKQLHDLKEELQDTHQRYKNMLTAIEIQIADFDSLYNDIKVGILPGKLRELKQILPENSHDFIHLKEIIQKTYRL